MADFGIKIAPKNQNVYSVSDKDLASSSKYTTLKILAKGIVTITTDGSGNVTKSIPHGLPYAPTFYVFRKDTASWQKNNPGAPYNNTYTNCYFPNTNMVHSWVANHDATSIYSDKTNLYIQMITAAANTNYTFVYYIFVDVAQTYNQVSSLGINDIGIKVAPPGIDINQRKEYELAYSSRYRSLRYYPTLSGTVTMTLPLLFSSMVTDPSPESATYVDVNHFLGYAPFFLAFYTIDDGVSLPGTGFAQEVGFEFTPTNIFTDMNQVDSFCDNSKIRFTFWRRAHTNQLNGASYTWPSQNTVTIRYLIFNEDLSDFT